MKRALVILAVAGGGFALLAALHGVVVGAAPDTRLARTFAETCAWCH